MPGTEDPPRLYIGESAKGRCAFFTLPDGARLRYAVIEPRETPRGTFLIAPGRREFIEKKYAETGPELLARNFRLIFFDWRGQGFSSRFLPGARYQRDHIADFDVYLNDLRAFYEGAIRPQVAGPLFVLGHSMGGFNILRWLAETQPPVKAAVLTAPMLALALPAFAGKICALAIKLGFGARYAPWQHDYDQGDMRFAGNVLSQDPLRFGIMEKYFTAHPEMKVGGVTWQWLDAALRAIEAARQPGYLANIAAPTLVLAGDKDIVTPPARFRDSLKGLPMIEDHIIGGACHDLLNELEFYRKQAWERIDRFIGRIGA
ncbi:MAG TPA: alpha/beta hydrolase [Alphaproteobacteria bacterium]|nr:alpha/beta hydrolase [Alphaproteobacteria bacterium]